MHSIFDLGFLIHSNLVWFPRGCVCVCGEGEVESDATQIALLGCSMQLSFGCCLCMGCSSCSIRGEKQRVWLGSYSIKLPPRWSDSNCEV